MLYNYYTMKLFILILLINCAYLFGQKIYKNHLSGTSNLQLLRIKSQNLRKKAELQNQKIKSDVKKKNKSIDCGLHHLRCPKKIGMAKSNCNATGKKTGC